MASLQDYIDRFSRTVHAIQETNRQIATLSQGPHVRAALNSNLGDLARDIDASELGLFTLVHPPTAGGKLDNEDAASTVQRAELARVEFPGASPLKKPAHNENASQSVLERDPEVYAEAALKYLDRYRTVRNMPRARAEIVSILEQLSTLREDIEKLSETVQQNEQTEAASISTAKGEERRIQELNLKIKQLKARKEVLSKKQNLSVKTDKLLTKPDVQEEAFWADAAPKPKARSRVRNSLAIPVKSSADDSLILDSHIDMGEMLADVTMDSLVDAPASISTSKRTSKSPPILLDKSNPSSKESVPHADPSPIAREPETMVVLDDLRDTESIGNDNIDHEEESDTQAPEDEGDKTVVLIELPSSPPPTTTPLTASSLQPSRSELSSTPPPRSPPEKQVFVTPVAQSNDGRVPATPATGRKSKYKVTTDMERIVAKVWSTVGDVIMPGHPFNTASAATTNKPPRAKETLALLENITNQSPLPSSPSTLSTFSLADHTSTGHLSIQQVLTAHLILTLLSSPPNYSMPLNKAKEALAAKGLGEPPVAGGINFISAGIGGQGEETRALYKCVAKRLVKIDRREREQILRFDL